MKITSQVKEVLDKILFLACTTEIDEYVYACDSIELIDTITSATECSYIGGGHFSIVLSHPSLQNHVIKVNLREDKAYEAWADHCMEEEHPLYPEILYKAKDYKRCIYILKQYEELPSDYTGHCWILEDLFNGEIEPFIDKFGDIPNPFTSFISKLRNKNIGFISDVQVHNVMWDSVKNNLVITDPVA